MSRRSRTAAGDRGSVMLVARYDSNVGYAWWLMENYWRLIADRVAAQGRRCILAYPSISTIPETIAGAPLEIAQLDFSDRSFEGNKRLLSSIRDNDVTSLYLTDRPFFDRRYPLLRAAGIRTIVTHDHAPGERPARNGVAGFAKSLVYRIPAASCDWFVAATDFIKNRMIRNARVPANRCIVVPNGVKPCAYAEADRIWAREELRVNESDFVVGLVSRASAVKRIDFVVRCAAHPSLSAAPTQIVFAYCGDGPELSSLRDLAMRLGVSDRFRFLGRRDDARRLMAGFDAGMHASRAEVGYCLAILEMMYAGLPVIVPDRPSVAGATNPGVTGLLYRDADESSAASAISALAADRPRARRLGEAARLSVAADYSLDVTNQLFRERVVSLL